MFGSNFLNTNLFKNGVQNYSVWFVLSVFAFACGWLINKTLGWLQGGKIVFSVTVATSILSIIMISIFHNYFMVGELVSEKLVLFTLRNVTLGAMGFFGMTVSEVFILQSDKKELLEKVDNYEKIQNQAEKQADLTVREAEVKAEKILLDAERKAKQFEDSENELLELIQSEKELIKQYEKEDSDNKNG
jgi:hypothetical protein